jgi:23S rRNA pseudouridine2605 synthase
MLERLHKYLAHCGIASRRDCEVLIEEGRVEVNGEVVTRQGTKVDPANDQISVDGERVKMERPVYYLVNKPRGYLCTNDDQYGRPRVVDLVREDRRIYTVGRLDEDSEGLILLTNDGTLANVLTHPRYQFDKTYKLLVRGAVSRDAIRKIEEGVWLSEGRTAPSQVRRVTKKGVNSVVTVTLWEGRNRELRRIFAKVGLRVQSLERTAIGPLRTEGLPRGAYRRLDSRELAFAFARLKPDWRPKAKAEAAKKQKWKKSKGKPAPRTRTEATEERSGPTTTGPTTPARRGRTSGRPTRSPSANRGRGTNRGNRPPRSR